ncbi:MAG: sigma-70 family RNA polymerase sigma factor [Anaerolineales bacterium]|nr:sigma-70 family RNA polymerase sigma factor [Anaerolineales bacterium]
MPAFIEQVRRAIDEGVIRSRSKHTPEKTIRRATINLYCKELYRACDENGSPCQYIAFKELGRYAKFAAEQFVAKYYSTPVIVDDWVQSAIVKVWENLDKVRDPGGLLHYIGVIVKREIMADWRKKQTNNEIPSSRLLGQKEEAEEEDLTQFWESLASVPPADDRLIAKELRDRLLTEIRRVLYRSQRRQAVIVGHYFYGLSYLDLADMLNTTVSNIHVIKSKALKSLRNDDDFIEQFGNYLELL